MAVDKRSWGFLSWKTLHVRGKLKGVLCGGGNPDLSCRKQFTPSRPFREDRTLISVCTHAGKEQIIIAFSPFLSAVLGKGSPQFTSILSDFCFADKG